MRKTLEAPSLSMSAGNSRGIVRSPAYNGDGPTISQRCLRKNWLSSVVHFDEEAGTDEEAGSDEEDSADEEADSDEKDSADGTRPATDIAAVLEVIGRRPAAGRDLERLRDWSLDLRRTDLRGIVFLREMN